MLAEPQTITVNAVPQTLKRVSMGVNSGVLKTNDGNWTVEIAHSYNKRVRHTVALRQRKIVADPLAPTINTEVTQSVRITLDSPANAAFTVADQKFLMDGFAAWLAAGSGAIETQLLGGES